MKEVWKDIKGYENKYQISNFGRMKRKKHSIIMKNGISRDYNEMIIKPFKNINGYMYFTIRKNNKKKNILAHRVVALHFIENKHNKKYVNHKDMNKENNFVKNLEWCTNSENIKHAISNGYYKKDYCSKPIEIYKKGILIGKFESVRKACRDAKLCRSTVMKCINKKSNYYTVNLLEKGEFYERRK